MKKTILNISRENFSPFGDVIEFSSDCEERFEIITKEQAEPWRIAVYRYKEKSISKMENHPTSMESFEPLTGTTLLMVAENKTPQDYKVFLLDKPVCLHKGIWHQVISLSSEASVKITENLEVTSQFYEFDKEIEVIIS
ncbi:ureidoglycolate lyase [[Clostridium] dakarense]|uniref:ureidoglycolate lyase n=1 Tax=Faecalimicrobium dakarense TaxID=1301100 RepID=UPI0004B34560|nr:ureidoglycolate lyase [[Clostridium] dakarense]